MKNTKIPLTQDLIKELGQERLRTRLARRAIYELVKDKLDISYRRLERIFYGQIKEVDRQEYNVLIETLRSVPTEQIVPIPEKTISIIKEYRDHKLSFAKALQYDRKNRPKKLYPIHISKWLQREITQAPQYAVEYVTKNCAALLKEHKEEIGNDGYVFIDDAIRNEIRSYMDFTHMKSAAILSAPSKPTGLKPAMINRWLTSHSSSKVYAPRRYVEYVINRYKTRGCPR